MSATDSLLFPEQHSGPDYSIEQRLVNQGYRYVAGVDEAGRGPLAGPVVAAAVILDPENVPEGLNDSKQVSESRREQLFTEILTTSHVAWTSLCAPHVDRINIREAALLAMSNSVGRLAIKADAVIVDGRDVPISLAAIGTAYVKGDSRSVSIAAASIVAKVVRDRMMIHAGSIFPEYGFEKHKGYGSNLHRQAISEYGGCSIHRMSFAPLKYNSER